MQLTASDLKKIINECLDNSTDKLQKELSRLNENLTSEIFGNSQSLTILGNEINHIRTQVHENTTNLKDSMDSIRDLRNIAIGTDGQNGLRSRIGKLEDFISRECDNNDDAVKVLKTEIEGIKQWKAKIIGITIGLWLIGSTMMGFLVMKYMDMMFNKSLELNNEKHIQQK